MKKSLLLFSTIVMFSFLACGGKAKQTEENKKVTDSLSMQQEYIKADIYETNAGTLKVTLVGHGSLMFEYGGKIIHVDPYSQVADYSKLPKADLILLTHEHGDHLDTAAINAIKKADTHYIVSKVCNEILGYGEVMNNGGHSHWGALHIDAFPAYNIVNKKPDGEAYHPKGRGNAYIITFGDKRVYVAADTENIPEMESLKGQIDIAFMPKNLPYTMTDEMFIDAVKKVEPKVVYPYHMSEFDQGKIGKALESVNTKIEVRPMKNN
ncbi:L-ascorbate metabolism protein UlaG (beta-lactamase superfamily) [Dysgonomonas hofstadii]|uniref:L-ascorbate metabolism protein UlaG (Beta-lactamase superfamily) n=1 Tax=Dysgonomonas hofstadii TaxID=637886 RepID=A0A840CQJ6_9BACT|nr:MBL fold metallo-hydrolase [Dysgonomonas hofstadii]MBB4035884.1 L-ascorbate metabolism protein UlaG (beta-lactamase superfamily) [Dysgonomonas hofstadii]